MRESGPTRRQETDSTGTQRNDVCGNRLAQSTPGCGPQLVALAEKRCDTLTPGNDEAARHLPGGFTSLVALLGAQYGVGGAGRMSIGVMSVSIIRVSFGVDTTPQLRSSTMPKRVTHKESTVPAPYCPVATVM